jgi:hypothetical protein
MGRAYTHVVKYNGGVLVDEIGPLPDRELFAAPLRRFDGRQRWGLGLFPVPEDTTYNEMLAADREFTSYLQAGGSADALTVEIRKSVGGQGDFQEIRYVVGHADRAGLPRDVEIAMPNGPVNISAAEVFDAEEAADIFDTYHQSGDIPAGFTLRPAQGYRTDGSAVDLDASD